MEESQDPQFSFQSEIEPFLRDNFIKSCKFLEGGHQGSTSAIVVFETLENGKITAEWSTQKGIKVTGFYTDDPQQENDQEKLSK